LITEPYTRQPARFYSHGASSVKSVKTDRSSHVSKSWTQKPRGQWLSLCMF